jgi:hypothetical protein
MVREHLALDGAWDFYFDRDGSQKIKDTGDIQDWQIIHVPGPWQAQFHDLRETAGIAWYHRSFAAPETWKGQMVYLHFEAVNYYTEIWVNGQLVGTHQGGYLPFEFELSAYLQYSSANELLVRVTAPSDNPKWFPDFPFAEIPHGKQSWYGVLGGIWQSVWIETRSTEHISNIALTPDLSTGKLHARVTLFSLGDSESKTLGIRIHASDGRLVHEGEKTVPPGTQHVEVSHIVPDPLPWSPETPHLYHFSAALVSGSSVCDEYDETFGFRTIETRDGKLFLNGDLLYLRGALDQDYYPDTICTPPSEDFLEDHFRKAKAMGLNCVRCHIKIPDPRYLAVADRVGMLVWLDIPNTGRLTTAARERLEYTLRKTLERDFNHPSIIIWTIINEDWGTDLVHDAGHRQWLRDMYRWLKDRDPSRLVIDNSACWPNFHIETDIEDYHFYRAMPDHRRDWDDIIDQFAHRADWTFSSHGDAVRSGNEPLVVSEFGNWGLPDANLLSDDDGNDPWWFETGMDWGDGIAYPHGIQQRFYAWHLDRVFGDWQSLIAATQWQQYQALKYEIESMRRHPQLAGYVITELTDVHWEANGLLDMARNPKVFYNALAQLNADTVVIPVWDRLAYWAGETVCIGLQIAHGGNRTIENTVLQWQLQGHSIRGVTMVSTLAPGTVITADDIVFDAPLVEEGQQIDLVLTLAFAQGDRIAVNRLTLTVFPVRKRTALPDLVLWTPESELHDYCKTLGYNMTSSLETADIVLARRLTEAITAYVRDGGQLLLLADQPDSIPACAPGQQVIEPCFPYTQMIARAGTFWAGDWVSSFTWLRRDGQLSQLPGDPLTDLVFENIAPEYVLSGFSRQDFEAHVYAGMFLGWIHRNVALLAVRHYGKGRALLTTFRLLRQAPEADPVATVLLDALIAMFDDRVERVDPETMRSLSHDQDASRPT